MGHYSKLRLIANAPDVEDEPGSSDIDNSAGREDDDDEEDKEVPISCPLGKP